MISADEVLKRIAAHLERESWNSIKNNASDYEELLRETGLGELIAAGQAMRETLKIIYQPHIGSKRWDAALSYISQGEGGKENSL